MTLAHKCDMQHMTLDQYYSETVRWGMTGSGQRQLRQDLHRRISQRRMQCKRYPAACADICQRGTKCKQRRRPNLGIYRLDKQSTTCRSEIDPGCKHRKSPRSRRRIACVRLCCTPCSSCILSAPPSPGTCHSHTEGTTGCAQRYPPMPVVLQVSGRPAYHAQET